MAANETPRGRRGWGWRAVGGGAREESEKRVGRAKRRKIDVKRNGKGVKQSVTGRTKWVISRWPVF